MLCTKKKKKIQPNKSVYEVNAVRMDLFIKRFKENEEYNNCDQRRRHSRSTHSLSISFHLESLVVCRFFLCLFLLIIYFTPVGMAREKERERASESEEKNAKTSFALYSCADYIVVWLNAYICIWIKYEMMKKKKTGRLVMFKGICRWNSLTNNMRYDYTFRGREEEINRKKK